MRRQRFTPEQVISALQAKRGMVGLAARMLGCHAKTVHRMIDRHPQIKAALEDQRSQMLDVAESALLKLISEGNVSATIFFLKTRGKERGYVERVQHLGVNVSLTAEDLANLTDEEIDACISRLTASEGGTRTAEPPALASDAD